MGLHQGKQLIVFDLDKTLSGSKQIMDDEMAALLRSLLNLKKVAVISGGSFGQFQKQFVPKLTEGKLCNLFLFPTCGSAFYRHGANGWENVYAESLSAEEKRQVYDAFERMFDEIGFKKPETIYGELIEDRGTQITFGAFGSAAPLAIKGGWDPDRSKRLEMIGVLESLIPEFEIRTGGTASIDVTRKGIDKAHGIRQMQKYLNVSVEDIVFVGDDFGLGGNDYPVIATGVSIVAVDGPEDTKRIIRRMIEAK